MGAYTHSNQQPVDRTKPTETSSQTQRAHRFCVLSNLLSKQASSSPIKTRWEPINIVFTLFFSPNDPQVPPQSALAPPVPTPFVITTPSFVGADDAARKINPN